MRHLYGTRDRLATINLGHTGSNDLRGIRLCSTVRDERICQEWRLLERGIGFGTWVTMQAFMSDVPDYANHAQYDRCHGDIK